MDWHRKGYAWSGMSVRQKSNDGTLAKVYNGRGLGIGFSGYRQTKLVHWQYL